MSGTTNENEVVPTEIPLVVSTPQVVVAPDDNTPAAETIQIGDKTFTSNDDAIAYAKQLQSTVATNDAYQQGINDAMANQSQVQTVTNEPVVEAPLFDDAEFYENPQKVIKDVMQKATATAETNIRAENAQKEKAGQMWTDFYIKYPRLQKSSKLVKQVLDENWAVLGSMPDGQKAMDILAQKATDQINTMISDFMPGQELPITKQATSPGGQVNVTPPVVDEPVLDFMAQAKQNYKL